ncbi:VOC family protein [Fibrella sp. WM1]|uniref:VOC family protein n=1 Tax=Fibrella musci TaxID=3242485 RepID=UPI00352199C2
MKQRMLWVGLVGLLLFSANITRAQASLQGFSHVVLPIRELGVSLPFYRNVLGLTGVAVPGTLSGSQAWFDIGGGQQLRLVERRTDVSSLRTSGVHVALQVGSLRQAEQLLKQHSAAVIRQTGASGLPVLQLNDPDGYLIELYEGKANKPGFIQSAGKWFWKSITSVD